MPIVQKIKLNKKSDFKMPEWMECSWRRVVCGKDSCPLCGRLKRNRQKHIEKGEDPDDMKNVLEDVGSSFAEAMEMIRKDAERMGIDIVNLDKIKMPPRPYQFSLYRKVKKWRDFICLIGEGADRAGDLWIFTEAAADLFWYANTLAGKTYRQLSNRWEMENGDAYGEADFNYTRYVLGECFKILKRSLGELSLLQSEQKGELIVAAGLLVKLEKTIEEI